MGEYREIHSFNREYTPWYNDRIFSYVRWKGEDRLIILANFDPDSTFGFELQLPGEIIALWNLEDGSYTLEDQLSDGSFDLTVSDRNAETRIDIEPLRSFILQLPAD